jgi:hypothetical protein
VIHTSAGVTNWTVETAWHGILGGVWEFGTASIPRTWRGRDMAERRAPDMTSEEADTYTFITHIWLGYVSWQCLTCGCTYEEEMPARPIHQRYISLLTELYSKVYSNGTNPQSKSIFLELLLACGLTYTQRRFFCWRVQSVSCPLKSRMVITD